MIEFSHISQNVPCSDLSSFPRYRPDNTCYVAYDLDMLPFRNLWFCFLKSEFNLFDRTLCLTVVEKGIINSILLSNTFLDWILWYDE